MIVIDASVVAEVILRTPKGLAIEPRLAAEAPLVNAPHLIDLEIANVLRRLVLRREISAERGAVALEDFAKIPIFKWAHAPLLPRVWALRDNVTAYDAAYVSLAELLEVPLVTLDRRLAASAGHRARIEIA